MNDFEAMIMPNDNFQGKTILPNERPSMASWFVETNVTSQVPKHFVTPKRHVFDIKRFQRNQRDKQGKLLTFLNIFRTFTKKRVYGNANY